jgi:hypothetical protein
LLAIPAHPAIETMANSSAAKLPTGIMLRFLAKIMIPKLDTNTRTIPGTKTLGGGRLGIMPDLTVVVIAIVADELFVPSSVSDEGTTLQVAAVGAPLQLNDTV